MKKHSKKLVVVGLIMAATAITLTSNASNMINKVGLFEDADGHIVEYGPLGNLNRTNPAYMLFTGENPLTGEKVFPVREPKNTATGSDNVDITTLTAVGEEETTVSPIVTNDTDADIIEEVIPETPPTTEIAVVYSDPETPDIPDWIYETTSPVEQPVTTAPVTTNDADLARSKELLSAYIGGIGYSIGLIDQYDMIVTSWVECKLNDRSSYWKGSTNANVRNVYAEAMTTANDGVGNAIGMQKLTYDPLFPEETRAKCRQDAIDMEMYWRDAYQYAKDMRAEYDW